MIKNLLKGAVIGLANIIPGVSGGTMAVSMGIYDKLISAVTNLFKEFKKSVKFLLPVVLGAAVGIVGLAFIIRYLLENYPFQTNLLFIGLIVGGLPAVWKKVRGASVRPGHIVALLIFFIIVVGFAAIGEKDRGAADLTVNAVNLIKLFGVGIIASATMVVPGVSGSMILMLMGYYHPILNTITDFIKALAAFDMPGLMSGFAILFPFGIGVILGIFLIAKLIEIVFRKFPLYAYWAIIGLIAASPVAIVLMNSFGSITVLTVITGVIALALGVLIAGKLGEE